MMMEGKAEQGYVDGSDFASRFVVDPPVLMVPVLPAYDNGLAWW